MNKRSKITLYLIIEGNELIQTELYSKDDVSYFADMILGLGLGHQF